MKLCASPNFSIAYQIKDTSIPTIFKEPEYCIVELNKATIKMNSGLIIAIQF